MGGESSLVRVHVSDGCFPEEKRGPAIGRVGWPD